MKLKIFLLLLGVTISQSIFGQDFFRIAAAHDFQKNKVVQTFSFDFNRTEKIDEKRGRFLLYDKRNFYLLPTSDVNLGDGVTSSENNVLFQLYFGKAILGKLRKSDDKLTSFKWNKAIELNPSYNSDKLFAEKLVYGQLKFLLNFLSQKHSDASENGSVKTVHSISSGLFTNIGYRNSVTYKKDDFYSTIGFILDYKTRILNDKIEDNWVFKITGNYYYIASDVNEITSDQYAGILKASIDKKVYTNIFCGINYKYGNDNPNYKYVHTLELSAKLRY
ncbi:MAG: hypothetical protein NTZ47_00970 [Bacteroidetes bacterium]|nr:hypothetical protein [Bacteroidota bacterium]